MTSIRNTTMISRIPINKKQKESHINFIEQICKRPDKTGVKEVLS
ncbi:MAG TPA: hypothetical protein VMZ29_00130 [Candidatus Bathyarchaeia archaeon]|nr:hypothetical protein [Candidatus Bathyarchaeia archaeon]